MIPIRVEMVGKVRTKDGKRVSAFSVSKRGKYNQQGRYIEVEGKPVFFPSMAEANRYEQLREMLGMGRIAGLDIHPRFECRINGILVCRYEADFRYRTRPNQFGGRIIVEDVKGMRTPTYKMKLKLMAALHPTVEVFELYYNTKRGGGSAIWRYLTADEIKENPDVGLDARAARATGAKGRRAGAEADVGPDP